MSATERAGSMSFEELDSLNTRFISLDYNTKVNSVNKTAGVDVDSGTVTAVGVFDITDSTKSWVVNSLVDNVVRVTTADGVFEHLVIASNTATKLVFDSDIILSSPTTYRILDTLALTDSNVVVAVDVLANCCAVLIPKASSVNERKYINVYIEKATNGDHMCAVVARETDRFRGFKELTLNHKFEGVTFLCHTWGTPHYDISNIENVKRYITSRLNLDLSLGSTTYIPVFSTADTSVEYAKRFNKVDRSGSAWFQYTSKITNIFTVVASMTLFKPSVGDTVIDFAVRHKDYLTGVITDSTTPFTVRLVKDGYALVDVNLSIELEHGDEITIVAKRDTGVVSLLSGSNIRINEI